ncbi:lactate utilization protein C [Pseudomonas boanensis]|uniref:LutC/YkgG family protein n=1 Tax=Metapseudomonas boanensis TaxID=2822138 RepID=UPI0035D4D6A7
MSSARQQIFANLRGALGRRAEDEVASPPSIALGTIPLNDRSGDVLEARFRERLAMTGVTLETLTLDEVPAAVADYLARHALKGSTAIAPALASLAWSARELPVDIGTADRQHTLGVGQAYAGIAATGSLVMVASSQSPSALNFLPEHHLVVLSRARLLGHLDQLWPLLAREGASASQAIQLITGPSSTADIGGQLLYGAHGPRAVHVLLVD